VTYLSVCPVFCTGIHERNYLQFAHAQVVQLAPNVRNKNVLRASGKIGLPLNDASPFA
jgi:hypothetical protein